MFEDIIFEMLLKTAVKGAEDAVARLDLFWERAFGRTLSGRISRIEIQTLFHGNLKDQDQI
jgi:hypothetical protein